ncbi:MAG TPA: hypothetical protein VNQ57_01815 [Ureibacillus sp.]|nr:hypothetical protein [Ureibacillus sp.]
MDEEQKKQLKRRNVVEYALARLSEKSSGIIIKMFFIWLMNLT